jgi:membrane associated rhomboid family serine protease
MGGASIKSDFSRFFTRGGSPVTFGLMAALVVTVVLSYTGVPVHDFLALHTPNFPVFFWTLFTWPVAPSPAELGPFGLIFALGWAYLFGGSLERSWGTRDYAKFLILATVLTGVLVWAASGILRMPTGVSGLVVAMSPVVVAWSVVNAREVINFWFLPIPGPVWGIIAAAVAYIGAGGGVVGLFALPACAAAYWYAKFGRYGYRGNAANPGVPFGGLRPGAGSAGGNDRFRNFDREGIPGRRGLRGFNVFKWWKDRQERKRLEEIFRRSGLTEDEDEDATGRPRRGGPR